MSRSKFTRLGDHFEQNRADDVRRRAAAGDPEAVAEADLIDGGLEPHRLLEKCEALAADLVGLAAGVLRQLKIEPPPKPGRLNRAAYADMLLAWSKSNAVERDSLAGRMVYLTHLCAVAMKDFDVKRPDYLLGFVLGYGAAKTALMAMREYHDGPAIARERVSAPARSRGGEERKKLADPLTKRIQADFLAAKKNKPSIKANGWAAKHAAKYGLSQDRVGKIARAALVKPGEP